MMPESWNISLLGNGGKQVPTEMYTHTKVDELLFLRISSWNISLLGNGGKQVPTEMYTHTKVDELLFLRISKIGMICSAKPVLTEDLYIGQEKRIFNNILYVRYVHLTKGQTYS
jgi:hypothetical protein